MRTFLGLLAVGLLASCGDGNAARKSVENDQLILAGQQQVSQLLRNPETATFSDVFISRVSGTPAVCGYVNAENGFGGMTGRQRFIAGGAVALEEQFEPAEFQPMWSQLCRENRRS